MADVDVSLVAHLMRRAGFGASRLQLEELASRPYEDVVEDLLRPERFPEVDETLLQRYHGVQEAYIIYWMHRMLASPRQLQEKMTLFWHHVFATAGFKDGHEPSMGYQLDMFRRIGLSDLRTILTGLSKDPAMLGWLDNNENIKGEPNENYGRELLELFSMGVGNYSEEDIKTAALAFTGWSYTQPIPRDPYSNYPTRFVFRPEEHDDSEKSFLGETGRFNGEDIVDIIVKQPATARFICRRLYDFFVADEPQVPAWSIEPPRDPEAIDILVAAYFDSGGDIRSIMRVLLSSDFFKQAHFKRVKSPAELVTGVMKLVGANEGPSELPDPGVYGYLGAVGLMGQLLGNPPTVEGWHTGTEWIDGGALNERIDFAVDKVGDETRPGVKAVVRRMGDDGGPVPPREFVDRCLDQVGPLTVGGETREALLSFARSGGDLRFSIDAERAESANRIRRMMQLIVSSTEYQFA